MDGTAKADLWSRVKEQERELADLRGRCVNGTLRGDLPDGFLECFKNGSADFYFRIFSYMSPSDLLRLREVCSDWNEMIVWHSYHQLDGFREGSRPVSIRISPQLAADGGVRYQLSADGVASLVVSVDTLRFCVVPFSRHKFTISLEGLSAEKALEALSMVMDAFGDITTINVTRLSITKCHAELDGARGDDIAQFTKSPHCRNLEELEFSNANMSVPFPEPSDEDLSAIVSKKALKCVTFENCSLLTPEGVVRAVENLFSISDRIIREGHRETLFRSTDTIKLYLRGCRQLQKEEMMAVRRPTGDVADDLPFRTDGDLLVLTFKSTVSRLPVDVYIKDTA
ncbi:hypothetical protein QR680_013250 [Steinernema hermaphroditum]|uniref:F-box domain-containing protein n=1 Tax=Steinernema hermaphroditum TaxID=289476 RepID=A0AA39I6F4_9BILA|nr:hypothetical protein QR680_013250 [Steinernema hermaphroditum]